MEHTTFPDAPIPAIEKSTPGSGRAEDNSAIARRSRRDPEDDNILNNMGNSRIFYDGPAR